MAKDFFIPNLGENIEQATIVDWLVEDGAEVSEGDDILELETDKATVPVPANAAGHIHLGPYSTGDVVEINDVVATIGGKDEQFAPGGNGSNESDESSAGDEPAASTSTTAQPAKAETQAAGSDDIRVTPVARKMAAEMGVELQAINGSGERGKITKADVLQATSDEPAAAPKAEPAQPKREAAPAAQPASKPAAEAPKPKAAPSAPPTPDENVKDRIPLKGIRGVIARRMDESVHTTARVTLMTEVDVTEFVALRGQLKAKFAEEWGFAPGYNDLLVMIVASALREFPVMNARFSADGESIEYLKPIHMGMAVDTDRGLLVPVLKDANQKGLKEIGSEFRDLVKKVRSGKASPSELSGSTFTITSLGTFRVDAFTPVINLPEAAILGVGRIKAKPVVKDNEIVIRQMMSLSLVFDHRLVDGAPAARFLDYICEMLEEPDLIFLLKR